MALEFDKTLSEAEEWLLISSSPFQLLDIDPVNKRLVFVDTSSDDSFYMIGPNRHPDTGKATWHLWSDNDDVLSKLYQIIDGLQSGRFSNMTDVLNSVHIALLSDKVSHSSLKEETEKIPDRKYTAISEKDRQLDERYHTADDRLTKSSVRSSAAGPRCVSGYQSEGQSQRSASYGAAGAFMNKGPSQTTGNDQKVDTTLAHFSGENASQTSVRRLLKDMKNLQDGQKYGIVASPRGDDLFTWDVKFTDFARDTKLGSDLWQYAQRYGRQPVLNMEMLFPQSYPFAPPFIRFIRPRFERYTGHVTVGGSVCMDLLTNSGWTPANSIEAILIQVRTELTSDPNCGLSSTNTDTPYDYQRALSGFKELVRRKGWDK